MLCATIYFLISSSLCATDVDCVNSLVPNVVLYQLHSNTRLVVRNTVRVGGSGSKYEEENRDGNDDDEFRYLLNTADVHGETAIIAATLRNEIATTTTASASPWAVHVFKHPYLRLCGTKYLPNATRSATSLSNPLIHLTNNSVQSKDKNITIFEI